MNDMSDEAVLSWRPDNTAPSQVTNKSGRLLIWRITQGPNGKYSLQDSDCPVHFLEKYAIESAEKAKWYANGLEKALREEAAERKEQA